MIESADYLSFRRDWLPFLLFFSSIPRRKICMMCWIYCWGWCLRILTYLAMLWRFSVTQTVSSMFFFVMFLTQPNWSWYHTSVSLASTSIATKLLACTSEELTLHALKLIGKVLHHSNERYIYSTHTHTHTHTHTYIHSLSLYLFLLCVFDAFQFSTSFITRINSLSSLPLSYLLPSILSASLQLKDTPKSFHSNFSSPPS